MNWVLPLFDFYYALTPVIFLPASFVVFNGCKNCLMTNQKPFSVNETKNYPKLKKLGMPIYKNGLCAACVYSLKKNKQIDWEKREKLLIKMLEK